MPPKKSIKSKEATKKVMSTASKDAQNSDMNNTSSQPYRLPDIGPSTSSFNPQLPSGGQTGRYPYPDQSSLYNNHNTNPYIFPTSYQDNPYHYQSTSNQPYPYPPVGPPPPRWNEHQQLPYPVQGYRDDNRRSSDLASLQEWDPNMSPQQYWRHEMNYPQPPYPSNPSRPSHPAYPPHPNASPNKESKSTISNNGGQSNQKKRKSQPQRTSAGLSDAEEVEAGLALAGMGLGLSPKEFAERRLSLQDSLSPEKQGVKKIKKEINGDEKNAEKKKGTGTEAKKSCAECRRLKSKCDRVFPCSNCRRRGCALVCPDGDLSCMQGKRLVLASTEQLHERIAQLEAALFHANKQISPTTHPLLSADHLDGGATIEKSESPNQTNASTNLSKPQPINNASPIESKPSIPNAMEVPAQPERRSSRMAVESLLIDEGNVNREGKKEDEWVGENAAPALIIGSVGNDTSTESDSLKDKQTILERLRSILSVLPDRSNALKQSERFWDKSIWYQNILRKEEYMKIYEPSVYSPTSQNPLTPHKLACVLMILTLDTYFDLSYNGVEGEEERNSRVKELWEGVQQCFDTRFGWAASVAGVQALALATFFVGFGWRGVGASNFYWLRQMTSAAQQLGLHKEPHESLPEAEKLFRRRVFHELYAIDTLLSINHGQRTAVPLEIIETKYPEDGESFMRLKYVYHRTVKNPVIEIGCQSDTASVDQSDREKRVDEVHKVLKAYDPNPTSEHHCPILTGAPMPPPSDPDGTEIDVYNLQRSTTSMCHFKALMFLFRPSLRRLISRLRSLSHVTPIPTSSTSPSSTRMHSPSTPLTPLTGLPSKSTSTSTTLTSHERLCIEETMRACDSIIRISGYIARTERKLSGRIWAIWVQTFSAAVSLAALVIWCGPYMGDEFVKKGYEQMKDACEMIRENGSDRAKGVLALLPILCNLVENRYPYLLGSEKPHTPMQQGEDMLFVLLGGNISSKSQTLSKPTNGHENRTPQSIALTGQSSDGGSRVVTPHSLTGMASRGPSQNTVPAIRTQSPLHGVPSANDQMITPLSSVELRKTQYHNQIVNANQVNIDHSTSPSTAYPPPQSFPQPIQQSHDVPKMDNTSQHGLTYNLNPSSSNVDLSRTTTHTNEPLPNLPYYSQEVSTAPDLEMPLHSNSTESNLNTFDGFNLENLNNLDPSEIWARLHALYEPSLDSLSGLNVYGVLPDTSSSGPNAFNGISGGGPGNSQGGVYAHPAQIGPNGIGSALNGQGWQHDSNGYRVY